MSTTQTYDSVLKKKEAELIGEVAATAWDEGMVNHVLLTGGCFSHEREVSVVRDILASIRGHRGVDRIPGTILDGVGTLTGMGANVVPFVWSPNPGSRLAGHRPPSAQWYAEVIREAAGLVLSGDAPSGSENHCYPCDGNNLLHDALRERGVS